MRETTEKLILLFNCTCLGHFLQYNQQRTKNMEYLITAAAIALSTGVAFADTGHWAAEFNDLQSIEAIAQNQLDDELKAAGEAVGVALFNSYDCNRHLNPMPRKDVEKQLREFLVIELGVSAIESSMAMKNFSVGWALKNKDCTNIPEQLIDFEMIKPAFNKVKNYKEQRDLVQNRRIALYEMILRKLGEDQ